MSLLMDALRKAEQAQQQVKKPDAQTAKQPETGASVSEQDVDKSDFTATVVAEIDNANPATHRATDEETHSFDLHAPEKKDTKENKDNNDDVLEWEPGFHPQLAHNNQEEWADPRETEFDEKIDWQEELNLAADVTTDTQHNDTQHNETPSLAETLSLQTSEAATPPPSSVAPDAGNLEHAATETPTAQTPPTLSNNTKTEQTTDSVPPPTATASPTPSADANKQIFAHQLQSASANNKAKSSAWFLPTILGVTVIAVLGIGSYFFNEVMRMQSSSFGATTSVAALPSSGGLGGADLKARLAQKRAEQAPNTATDAAPPETPAAVVAQAAATETPAVAVEEASPAPGKPAQTPLVEVKPQPSQPQQPPQTTASPPAPRHSEAANKAAHTANVSNADNTDNADNQMEEYLLVAEGPVQIKRRVAPHTLNQIVRRAFGSYQDGDFAAAEAEYRRALRIAPRSRQILLGLAACLLQQNQTTAAKRTYQEVLRLYPDDTVAESALLNMGEGRPDLNNESYLKSRLAEQPDNAYLHFALGNVFSSQQRWTEAQQAYFDAFRYDKINPNYVYNLAVSLEHLGKSSTALSFYEQAYSLSAQYPAQFNRQRLSQRIAQLKNG